jgi:hypothetical protein
VEYLTTIFLPKFRENKSIEEGVETHLWVEEDLV